MRITLNEESKAEYPAFRYKFTGKDLRVGDVVDGIYGNQRQFIYDARVVRPNCWERGCDLLRGGDYQVEVQVGQVTIMLYRNDISNVRRRYQIGDWAG